MNATEISLEPATPPPGCLAVLLAVGLVAGAVQVAFVAGCASPELPGLPEGALEFVTNHLDRIVSGDRENHEARETHESAPEETPEVSCDSCISWSYGGVDGSKSVEDPATQIRDLRISGDGLRYAWSKGDLSNWGLSRTDAGALACAFWWEGSRWVGGKFDWISTSRTTRDFKNIKDGYGGWDWAAFSGARRRAFCIVSKDGRKRTNIIEESR